MTLAPPGATAPALPDPRGPLSVAAVDVLRGPAVAPPPSAIHHADPYGEDLQLALYTLYEPHYRGFAETPDDREWDHELLRLRAALEDHFLEALRRDVTPARDVTEAFDALLVEPSEPGPGSPSHYLMHQGTLTHVREYAALRSLYHLKEADPHAWVIPRLNGRAKAAMVAIAYDEFGAGHADGIHARLFALLMADLGLDPTYGRYLDAAPAPALAPVNLMSLLGLRRALRGALVGHFAFLEVTSSPASRRLAAAMRRTGAGPAAEHFYTEHVVADAVHEQVVRHDVVGGLLADEPALAPDVTFGVAATAMLEDRLGDHLLTAWRTGHSALREDARHPATTD
ncbi:hypothetical protein AQ490_24725 [Wenjunlia vitaminophila]|uniref:Iron-containing redox enzyme n=1 Tax=Wenjunlia vitaminophila TaxID=76728 RepID=A0A0T6LQT2_WENVI|nr:iron-containing redox enzyme family protein [Wenjunlia vitaminophila]KRV48483.1 hypothetical protein AQ490_24725 [Wenjunlia vitaminophila]